MASVMAIGSEVFGRCVGEIDVSVVVKYGGVRLCCELNYWRFVLAGKAVQVCVRRWKMVPGIGGHFLCFGNY